MFRYAFNAAPRAIVLQTQRQAHASRSLLIATASPTCTRRRYGSVSAADVAARTRRLLDAKGRAGLTYDDLAARLGVTNAYAAQLLLGQARLSEGTAAKLQAALPAASADDLRDMQRSFPMRGFDDAILKEPNVYRTYEAVTHYGEAIKNIINEQCGDGECIRCIVLMALTNVTWK